jgi:hypothetical protein
MSLLRIRRERKSSGIGPTRPPRLGRLLVGLVLAIVLIWYMSTLI